MYHITKKQSHSDHKGVSPRIRKYVIVLLSSAASRCCTSFNDGRGGRISLHLFGGAPGASCLDCLPWLSGLVF